ncbi:MAG: transporter substrate-binding domain-containing protein [SAR324 cluster bacterium]|nr:transporter substrate-binding domain-containing protein [SAR324 cluster bacterium]
MLLRIFPWFIMIVFAIQFGVAHSEETLRVGVKSGKAPYIMASTKLTKQDYDQKRMLGIEFDLFKAALPDVTITPVYMNYDRMHDAIKKDVIDAGSNLRKEVEGIFYVDNFLRLYDHIIINTKTARDVRTIQDLKGKRVVAFQHASKYLDDVFRQAIKEAASYREIDDQEKQVRIFFAGRADVLITDIAIFKHWAKRYGNAKVSYEFTPLFPKPMYFSVGFKSETMRNRFQKGLDEIKASGLYDKIYGRYLE